MQRYIAFLRAINVGGHTVKMDHLRKLFEEMGFANVETFIASGNVIFESPAKKGATLEKKIEEHLRQSLGYDVVTFIRSAKEVAAVAEYHPFPPADLDAAGASLYIMFLQEPLSRERQEKLLALHSPVDAFHVHEREIYRLCRTKISESPLFSGTLLDKTIEVPSTTRNSTTVRKLAAKYAGTK